MHTFRGLEVTFYVLFLTGWFKNINSYHLLLVKMLSLKNLSIIPYGIAIFLNCNWGIFVSPHPHPPLLVENGDWLLQQQIYSPSAFVLSSDVHSDSEFCFLNSLTFTTTANYKTCNSFILLPLRLIQTMLYFAKQFFGRTEKGSNYILKSIVKNIKL